MCKIRGGMWPWDMDGSGRNMEAAFSDPAEMF